MGHHVALQKGWGTEHFSTGGARMVLSGVDFVDMFAVLLQGSKAHPALFAVIGIFYVVKGPEVDGEPIGLAKAFPTLPADIRLVPCVGPDVA